VPSVGFGLDWWRGVGCTVQCGLKHGRLGMKFLSTSSLGNCFLIDYNSREGVGSFELGRENSHSKFEKRMPACTTLSGDDEKESFSVLEVGVS
jgi:hypothetical protein